MTYKDNLNSKKFILATLIIFLNAVLTYFGLITDASYSTVVLATIGAYLTSNVMAAKHNIEFKEEKIVAPTKQEQKPK